MATHNNLLFFSLAFFLLQIIITPIISAQSSYIYNPTTGKFVAVVTDSNTYFQVKDPVSYRVIDATGKTVFTQDLVPEGEPVRISGTNPSTLGIYGRYDSDLKLYEQGGEYYDPNDGIWLGVHWPTFFSDLSSTKDQLGKGVISFGIWPAVEHIQAGGSGWDVVPVVGNIKGAIQAETWGDRVGCISGTVSDLCFIGAGVKAGVGGGAESVAGGGRVLFAEDYKPTTWEVMTNIKTRVPIKILEESNWRGSGSPDLLTVIKEAEIKPMTLEQRMSRPHARGLFNSDEPKIIRINPMMKQTLNTDKELASTLLHEGIHRRNYLLNKFQQYEALDEYNAYRAQAIFKKKQGLLFDSQGKPLNKRRDWRMLSALEGRDVFMKEVAQNREWYIPPSESSRRGWTP